MAAHFVSKDSIVTSTTTEPWPAVDGVWELDTVHSRVAFAVDFVAGPFWAEFSEFDATLDARTGDISLEGSALAESVNVTLPPFRAHLLGPEFFDAVDHPRILFRSERCETQGSQLDMTASLCVRGVWQQCVGSGTLYGPVRNQFGAVVVGVSLRADVDRHRFGLDWQVALPGGKGGLADMVRLESDLQFVFREDEAVS